MSVIQTNTWTCDICGATDGVSKDTDAYSDPVVVPPKGWLTDLVVPIEYRIHPLNDCADACPTCADTPNWRLYKARNSFPQEVIDKLGRHPRVGDWYMPCCIEDLQRVGEGLIYDLPDLLEENGGSIWGSLEEAIADCESTDGPADPARVALLKAQEEAS